ncbi:uncharacterized protein LOC129583126 [Paramacrobiotus metropolitanus]|uniref:uncharacterized protein LOC129583126 n=1 Tax=Paramacrobiotus metropolitanus TaxID=2943436 RepID=UPI002446092A|nr:uncharacterized protein LOC129583126 [Paramacrobiotus metropolitanus]
MLEDNNLTAVDWTIFEPLAASLKTIALSGNNIESIYFSHFFTLPGIEYVSLPGNSLTGITDQLLRSVAPYDLRPFLNIQFNPMCPVDVQCRCSSMDNLWDWYGKSPRLYRRLLPPGSTDCLNYPQADYFTCGNYSVLEYEPASSRFQNVLEATSGKSYQRCEAMDFANIARGAKSKARNPFGQLFPPTLGDYFLKMAAALEKTS